MNKEHKSRENSENGLNPETEMSIIDNLLHILEKCFKDMDAEIDKKILKKYGINKNGLFNEFAYVFINQFRKFCLEYSINELNESRINNASIIDQTTYETYHFDDYDADKTIIDVSLQQIEAKGHKACLIYRDTVINRVLEPFKFESKCGDNNDFHMSFSVDINNVNNDDEKRCSLESGKIDQIKVSNLLTDFLRELFDHRIVERIDIDGVSESKGRFFITVIIIPVKMHGNVADVASYIETFNMFPRKLAEINFNGMFLLQQSTI